MTTTTHTHLPIIIAIIKRKRKSHGMASSSRSFTTILLLLLAFIYILLKFNRKILIDNVLFILSLEMTKKRRQERIPFSLISSWIYFEYLL